jgi:hypothetical protein
MGTHPPLLPPLSLFLHASFYVAKHNFLNFNNISGRILMQVDPHEVAPRVTMTKHTDDLPITEQTFAQALHAARDTITKTLRS